MSPAELTPARATELLLDAGRKNPGPWTSHSMFAGFAARRIARAAGFCAVEIRMVDTVLRHRIREVPADKWKVVFDIMEHFNRRIGTTVYSLLPGIVHGTFGKDNLPKLRDEDPESAVPTLVKQ